MAASSPKVRSSHTQGSPEHSPSILARGAPLCAPPPPPFLQNGLFLFRCYFRDVSRCQRRPLLHAGVFPEERRSEEVLPGNRHSLLFPILEVRPSRSRPRRAQNGGYGFITGRRGQQRESVEEGIMRQTLVQGAFSGGPHCGLHSPFMEDTNQSLH